MKTLILALTLFSPCKSAWYDPLEEGGIEGYMTPENASSFLTSFTSNKFQKASFGTTSNNNQLVRFLLAPKTGSKTSNSTILITASHTTTQPLSTTMALYIAGYLSQDSSDLAKFFRSYFSIMVVPMVNIDGFYNMTNENNTLNVFLKNFNEECGTNPGVDLNRNFDFEFGLEATDKEKNSCSDTYQGTKAFSEKETAALRDLIAKNKVFIWMHFDGLKDQVVIPWTYSSGLKDFGSQYLNDSYKELQDVLDIKVNNSANLGLGTFGGSFVDYGASLGIYSMQVGLASSVVTQTEILKSCKKYNENIIKVFNASIKALQVTNLSWNVSDEDTQSNSSSVLVIVTFIAKNPSKLNHSVELYMDYNTTTANLTVEEVESEDMDEDFNSSSRSRSLSESNYTFELKQLSEKKIKTSLLVKGDPGDFAFDLNLQLILAGASDSNSFSILSSEIVTVKNIEGEIPFSDDSGGGSSSSSSFLFYRVWHRSAGHHEGVAVGLVTFFVSLLLILAVLYLVKLYKNLPESEEEEEPSSDYVKREVKTVKSYENFSPEVKTPDRSFDQRPGFKSEMSPLKIGKDSENVKNISIPIKVSKYGIDEDEKRAASPVINVPNRSKLPVKSPEPEAVVKRPPSPKAIYSTPSFPKEVEVPGIKSVGPTMKKNDSPEVHSKPLAPMDYGSVPEFNPKNEVRQMPVTFSASKEEPQAKPVEGKRPSGPVILKGSDSEDEIEILHAPNVSSFGAGVPSNPGVYKPHIEKSDDGEFEIMPVTESKSVKDNKGFMPSGVNVGKIPTASMFPPSISDISSIVNKNVEMNKKSSDRDKSSKSSVSSSSSSSSSSSPN